MRSGDDERSMGKGMLDLICRVPVHSLGRHMYKVWSVVAISVALRVMGWIAVGVTRILLA